MSTQITIGSVVYWVFHTPESPSIAEMVVVKIEKELPGHFLAKRIGTKYPNMPGRRYRGCVSHHPDPENELDSELIVMFKDTFSIFSKPHNRYLRRGRVWDGSDIIRQPYY